MVATSRSPLFTVADAWSGGFYELSFAYPLESYLGAGSRLVPPDSVGGA